MQTFGCEQLPTQRASGAFAYSVRFCSGRSSGSAASFARSRGTGLQGCGGTGGRLLDHLLSTWRWAEGARRAPLTSFPLYVAAYSYSHSQ